MYQVAVANKPTDGSKEGSLWEKNETVHENLCIVHFGSDDEDSSEL